GMTRAARRPPCTGRVPKLASWHTLGGQTPSDTPPVLARPSPRLVGGRHGYRLHRRRHVDGERRALARLALRRHVPAHHPAELPLNPQPQPCPLLLPPLGAVRLAERLEQPLQLLLRHPDPRVDPPERQPLPTLPVEPAARQRDRPLLGELAGVGKQVQQALP